jgi:hypothetical protein
MDRLTIRVKYEAVSVCSEQVEWVAQTGNFFVSPEKYFLPFEM